jgi:hypothetical protein
MWTVVSVERIITVFRVFRLPSPMLHAGILLGWFSTWDGGDTFLRNVGSHMEYTALYPRRWQHTYLPLWEPQIPNRFHFTFLRSIYNLLNFIIIGYPVYSVLLYNSSLSSQSQSHLQPVKSNPQLILKNYFQYYHLIFALHYQRITNLR